MITLEKVKEAVKAEFTNRDVYFSACEVPTEISIPQEWQDFGISKESVPTFPAAWRSFSGELPWLFSLLNIGLIGTAVLHGASIELLYIFHDSNGLYYYVGGLPLRACSTALDKKSPFKGKVSEFYHEVHNGFTFYPAQSMGPQKIEHLTCVAELIDEEDTRFASRWVTFFSNGAGDYLAVDLENSNYDQGIIWWHEQPLEPEVGVGVFEVMDTWMSIFLEDTQSRDNVILNGSAFMA